jgi:DNA-binding winged helix-turn-helix (wHTH) protein
MKKYKNIFSLNDNTLEIQNLQNGKIRNLTLNQFRLLECLLQGKGRKNEIVDYVWLVNNIVVSDGSYHQLIFQTRAIFDSIGLSGGMIKTFPRYGVKLVNYSADETLSDSDEQTNDADEHVSVEHVTTQDADSSSVSQIAAQTLLTQKKTERVTQAARIEENDVNSLQINQSAGHPYTSRAAVSGDGNEYKYKNGKNFFPAQILSRPSIILICSFFVGVGCSFFVLSPTAGFYILKYINHPPVVFSENHTTLFSDTVSRNGAKEVIKRLDTFNEQNGAQTQGSYRYGLIDDFYVYKALILCQLDKEPRTWHSSGETCENYILDY